MNVIHQSPNVNPSDFVITSQSFGLLRKALFENMGKEKAKRFLLRFGKELGTMKANELMQDHSSIEYFQDFAIDIHINLGHISRVERNSTSPFLIEDGEVKNISGKWIDSFEVDLHLKHHGLADECSCHTLSGFASGFMSTIQQRDIFVKELFCRSKGDPDCVFEVNTKEYWQKKSEEPLAIYDDQTILNELEMTYDNLLIKNKLLDKIVQYHDQLTECVTQENHLEEVVKKAFDLLNIPIIIKDLQGKIIFLHGLEVEDFHPYITNKKTETIDQFHKTTYQKVGKFNLLTTPIYLNNKVFANCSFVNLDSDWDENDYLFLERLSNVLSICLLNEKISFETTERLKISILDRLINKQYSMLSEITTQLKYLAPHIDKPFMTLSIKCEPKRNCKKPFDIYEQLLQFSKSLQKYFIDGLLSQHKDEIVILVFSVKDTAAFVNKMKRVLTNMEKMNEDIQYKIGISQPFDHLSNFEHSLKQAEQAVRFPRLEKMIHFEELGFLGILLQNMNVQQLNELAKKEMGILLEPGAKNKELLHTLYVYLMNGCRMEKTMRDLSLSLGGIQYRIRKIETILQKDLKDFSSNSYLLMLIESLLLLNDITFH